MTLRLESQKVHISEPTVVSESKISNHMDSTKKTTTFNSSTSSRSSKVNDINRNDVGDSRIVVLEEYVSNDFRGGDHFGIYELVHCLFGQIFDSCPAPATSSPEPLNPPIQPAPNMFTSSSRPLDICVREYAYQFAIMSSAESMLCALYHLNKLCPFEILLTHARAHRTICSDNCRGPHPSFIPFMQPQVHAHPRVNELFPVTILNIHRLILSLCLVCSKLHDDRYLDNQRWALYGLIPTSDLNKLEIYILSILPSLHVPGHEFQSFVRHLLQLSCHSSQLLQSHSLAITSSTLRSDMILNAQLLQLSKDQTSTSCTSYTTYTSCKSVAGVSGEYWQKEIDSARSNLKRLKYWGHSDVCICSQPSVFISNMRYWDKLERLASTRRHPSPVDNNNTAFALQPVQLRPLKNFKRHFSPQTKDDSVPFWSPPTNAIHILHTPSPSSAAPPLQPSSTSIPIPSAASAFRVAQPIKVIETTTMGLGLEHDHKTTPASSSSSSSSSTLYDVLQPKQRASIAVQFSKDHSISTSYGSTDVATITSIDSLSSVPTLSSSSSSSSSPSDETLSLSVGNKFLTIETADVDNDSNHHPAKRQMLSKSISAKPHSVSNQYDVSSVFTHDYSSCSHNSHKTISSLSLSNQLSIH